MAAICESYQRSFDAEKYHRLFYSLDPSIASAAELPCLQQRLSFLHEFYSQSGLQDAAILELGAGPTVYTLISAVPYAQRIVLADISTSVLERIRGWKERRPDCLDFTALFKHVVQELEGKGSEETMARENSLRDRIVELTKCDFRDHSHPLFQSTQFDVVSVHFCLHCSESADCYADHVKKLSSVLCPGGFLLLSDCLEQTLFTNLGNTAEKIPYPLCLTSDILLDSLRQSGLEITKQKTLHRASGTEITTATKMMMVAAKKPLINIQ